jgi:hypothetical protein
MKSTLYFCAALIAQIVMIRFYGPICSASPGDWYLDAVTFQAQIDRFSPTQRQLVVLIDNQIIS